MMALINKRDQVAENFVELVPLNLPVYVRSLPELSDAQLVAKLWTSIGEWLHNTSTEPGGDCQSRERCHLHRKQFLVAVLWQLVWLNRNRGG